MYGMLFASQLLQIWRQHETLILYSTDLTYDLCVSNGYVTKIRYIKTTMMAIIRWTEVYAVWKFDL
jgi:hypothetical protein